MARKSAEASTVSLNVDTIQARVVPPQSEKDEAKVEVTMRSKTFTIPLGIDGKSAAINFRDALNGLKYEYVLPKVPSETKKITFEWKVVTPEQALEWLASGLPDRRFHMSRVNRYASMIVKDGWLPVTDAIAFDSQSRRINGKHRLAAIAICGRPVVLLIAKNVPIEAQKGYDQGLPRGAADWLGHEFPLIPKKEITSPILRSILLLAAGGVGNQYTPETAEAIARKYHKDLIWFRKNLTKDREVNEIPLFKQSAVRTALVIGHHFYPKETNALVEDIIEGTNLRLGSPSRVLRDWLSNLSSKSQLTNDEKTFGVLRAIQAHITGERFPKSLPRTGADVLVYFCENRRDLIPEGTFLPEFGKKGGDPETRNFAGLDPRA